MDFKLFAKCFGCRKRKLYVSRAWIRPKHIPRVRPNEHMCRKCLKATEKVY